jgi:hypothetical protein
MLKFLALASCVVGFVFIAPKAVAEFRVFRPWTRGPLVDKPEQKIAA